MYDSSSVRKSIGVSPGNVVNTDVSCWAGFNGQKLSKDQPIKVDWQAPPTFELAAVPLESESPVAEMPTCPAHATNGPAEMNGAQQS